VRNVIDGESAERLTSYFGEIGEQLGNDSRRQSFATYAMGVLGEGERKSVEPIAARACADPAKADAAHQSLLHFVANARWSDEAVRRVAATHAVAAITEHGDVETWIVDDTGMLKQGKHSVGVHRQYTGSAGKITNCQIAVTLSVATAESHAPIDVELYIPRAWTDNMERRRACGVPDALEFKTKPQLALDMMRRAVKAKIPKGVLLADSAYGTSVDFRDGIRELGLHFAVGVDPQTSVWLLDSAGTRSEGSASVRDVASALDELGEFRRCTWRQGTKGDLSARFTARRVVPAYDDPSRAADQREELWLLVEWRDGEAEPANYFLSSLPKRWTKKQLIRIVMQRWRTERIYEDLKGELGFDHYEGRSFRGWHHHVTVVLCCYAFVIAERARRFPPSARDALEDDSVHVAA
jgi:SRSO17 transposase